MLTIGPVMLARRSASSAAACLRNPRCPTAPTGYPPSAAAVVLVRLPHRCHLSAGMSVRAIPHPVWRKLSDVAAAPCARTLSAAVLLPCAPLRGCRRNADGYRGAGRDPLVAQCVPCMFCCLCMLSDKNFLAPARGPGVYLPFWPCDHLYLL
jgi:hypothetical protein